MTEGALDPVELSRTLGQRLGFVRQPDDEKAFADAILAQLATDRLLWAVAPVEVGGFGANISQLARITFNLARLSGLSRFDLRDAHVAGDDRGPARRRLCLLHRFS